MTKLTIIFFLTIFTDFETSLEQNACDYFFVNVFKNNHPDYNAIEFDDQTDTTKYLGIVYKCENWNEKTKEQIVSTIPDKSTRVSANTQDVRVKKSAKNSGKLNIRVWSKIKVGDNYFVLIGAYRKLRFAEYFLFELNGEGKVIEVCKQGEII